MHILLSNDDGYLAQGLIALAEGLQAFAEISVVAPDRNRSAASNSLTLEMPLRAQHTANGFIKVDGTPTDCVHLAITGLLDNEPDMVFAGINHGANLGDDVTYSGTVSAAMEGTILGIPSIAVSQMGEDRFYFETSSRVAVRIARWVLQSGLPTDTLLNVNVPDLPPNRLKGFRIATLGKRIFDPDSIIEKKDPLLLVKHGK